MALLYSMCVRRGKFSPALLNAFHSYEKVVSVLFTISLKASSLFCSFYQVHVLRSIFPLEIYFMNSLMSWSNLSQVLSCSLHSWFDFSFSLGFQILVYFHQRSKTVYFFLSILSPKSEIQTPGL